MLLSCIAELRDVDYCRCDAFGSVMSHSNYHPRQTGLLYVVSSCMTACYVGLLVSPFNHIDTCNYSSICNRTCNFRSVTQCFVIILCGVLSLIHTLSGAATQRTARERKAPRGKRSHHLKHFSFFLNSRHVFLLLLRTFFIFKKVGKWHTH